MTGSDHFLGVDVGTGSVRVCAIDSTGEILAVESRDIRTWHPRADYYVCAFIALLSSPGCGGLTR